MILSFRCSDTEALAGGRRIARVSRIESIARRKLRQIQIAERLDLLHAAGAHNAKLLILAIDDHEKANEIAREIRNHYPQLKILTRADDLLHSYELLHIGVDQVFRETFDAALDLGADALKVLGFRAFQAHRAASVFKKHEHESTQQLYKLWEDKESYFALAKERVDELEALFQEDERDFAADTDHAWDAPPTSKDET